MENMDNIKPGRFAFFTDQNKVEINAEEDKREIT